MSINTPTKTPHSRSRSVLGEISLSASRFNVPSPVPSEKNRATTTAANRLIDFNRRTPQTTTHRRSPSTTLGLRQHRQSSKVSRHRFLQRVASPGCESSNKGGSIEDIETRLDLGNSENPIVHFRPQLWRHLEPTRDTLNLDLFWPQRLEELDREEDEEEADEQIQCEKNMFPLDGLLPLCGFRNLRSLRLSGMLQSYQTHIWRTCWMNPGLEELVLEMALEPNIHDLNRSWTPIDRSWRRKTISDACTEHLGDRHDGSLYAMEGEYLDKNAMASARSFVSSHGVNLRYLPIVKLVLAGFVVDAGPFFRWFNPMRLRQIEFKYGCIDAGFALPSHMNNLVTVSWPGKPPNEGQMITISRTKPQDIKTVWLKRKPSAASHANGLKPKISSILTKNWFSSARAHSLKARKANREHQQNVGHRGKMRQKSQASSFSDLSLFRQMSSSGISWSSKDFVDLRDNEQ